MDWIVPCIGNSPDKRFLHSIAVVSLWFTAVSLLKQRCLCFVIHCEGFFSFHFFFFFFFIANHKIRTRTGQDGNNATPNSNLCFLFQYFRLTVCKKSFEGHRRLPFPNLCPIKWSLNSIGCFEIALIDPKKCPVPLSKYWLDLKMD